MKSQGEIESAICDGISRFEQDYMGRGPKDIRTHLIGDLRVVRLRGSPRAKRADSSRSGSSPASTRVRSSPSASSVSS